MIAAIEGKRAMPRPRPPFPSTKGLWNRPTLINNVETLAHVPTIIVKGAEEFTKAGTEKSKGTKVFCLTGKIRRTGAVEVPLGTTIRRLIFDVGGGPPSGKAVKAVQTGGPSGGCLSEKFLDLPLDYETLQAAGSIMGSGGVVVLDEDTCIIDLARYFLTFTTAESCGKCAPCRIGLKKMLEMLTNITTGKGEAADLELLEDLAKTVAEASLCGLGRSAPNPVLTTLRYFGEEYEAHIKDKTCPSHVCLSLIKRYEVVPERCRSCALCIKECPSEAIIFKEFSDSRGGVLKKAAIDEKKCIRCGQCSSICPFNAVEAVW
jgi:NADH:ubiquinone oxidoreductase subunit F (NADH-binding)/NAD-dependent dihydropyrimidine dehydrogenase PreA subunit